jgi:hypothetical protein
MSMSMMDPAVLEQLIPLVVGTMGIVASFSFAALCFPSIRNGVSDWLSNRGLRNADAEHVSAELAALRGEVYALRAELATVTRALVANAPSPALPPPPNPPRITS